MTVFLLASLWGCGGPALSRDDLLNPESCAGCHPVHYEQWRGSMHAYAAKDPVFLAMNQRGQRETNGELGDFCVDCHAPIAARMGLTTDGTDLDEVPEHLTGVTCAYCHQVTDVRGDRNNPLDIAEDLILRGPFADAVQTKAHETEYSPLHDRDSRQSSELCGSCHDIETPTGLHLERTYLEWRESVYSSGSLSGLTCGDCHMRGSDGVAADVEGVPLRRIHDHSFAGVDIALTPFPGREAQLAAVQQSLNTTVAASLCVGGPQGTTLINLTLENVSAGHSWPSGAAHDRRAWVELRAFNGADEVWSSGVVEDGEPLLPSDDPNLWSFGDTLYNDSGDQVHMFWEATSLDSSVLPAPDVNAVIGDGSAHVIRDFVLSGLEVDRVEIRVRMRPLGLDVIDDLIASGDLDSSIREAIPTFDLKGPSLIWTAETATIAGDLSCVK